MKGGLSNPMFIRKMPNFEVAHSARFRLAMKFR